jgi:hypothetical protein
MSKKFKWRDSKEEIKKVSVELASLMLQALRKLEPNFEVQPLQLKGTYSPISVVASQPPEIEDKVEASPLLLCLQLQGSDSFGR